MMDNFLVDQYFESTDDDFPDSGTGVQEIEHLYGDMDWDNEINSGYSPNFYNNLDYNLNSPLIKDKLTSFWEYLTSDTTPTHGYVGNFPQEKKFVSASTFQPSGVCPDLHKWWSNYLLNEEINTCDFKKEVVDPLDSDAKETFEIPREFIKSLSLGDYKYKSLKNLTEECMRYGAIFWDVHKLVLMLNTRTDFEQKNLSSTLGAKRVINSVGRHIYGFRYRSRNFGNVLVGNEFITIPKYQVIVDLNFLLAMKDVACARFQSGMALEIRYDNEMIEQSSGRLFNLYRAGDKILAAHGSEAYKVIKMLESHCYLALAELAHEYRDKIPDFPRYRNHLMQKRNELRDIYPESAHFFNIVLQEENVNMLLTYFGSYRHWGHPYIDYLKGLRNLYERVTENRQCDPKAAKEIAGELIYTVLRYKFKNDGKWYVDPKKMADGHPLKQYVERNTWPALHLIQSWGNIWYGLPLLPCFEVPDMISVGDLYSDKSHSLQRSEVIKCIEKNPTKPIQTKKVLDTFIHTEMVACKEFLTKICDEGLDREDLMIGLKAKERELKDEGRFFALMTWNLREYIVMSEWLIARYFLPLFSDITMKDDAKTQMVKLLSCSEGQGRDDYGCITYANHLDYTKWNNYQRRESSDPLFQAMGDFLGMPNLFTRTHDFFHDSTVYYVDRPDLMEIRGDNIVSKDPDAMVAWTHQQGGFEGLRQKGWSLKSRIAISLVNKKFQTTIRCLTTGDNQVVCNTYKVRSSGHDKYLQQKINETYRNNDQIMKQIRMMMASLGDEINEDETLQSADMMAYGKLILFRGSPCPLETKRYSRVSAVTNDQLPSLGNCLSSAVTNCLTVAHTSHSFINPALHYNLLGNMTRIMTDYHNPALRGSTLSVLRNHAKTQTLEFKICVLYLDPSLGGVGGMSLNRFLCRQFPDPVTEALSFWKRICENTENIRIKTLAIKCGNPRLEVYKTEHFKKLLEDPLGLNIKKGVSLKTAIQTIVKEEMKSNPEKFENSMVKGALIYIKENEQDFLRFLESISPCFPRFLSEFYSATMMGVVDSITGLYVNSRTVRNQFSKRSGRQVDAIIARSEISTYACLLAVEKRSKKEMWKCSSTQADKLRASSWGKGNVIGATVPYPVELFEIPFLVLGSCTKCETEGNEKNFISVKFPRGLCDFRDHRGNYLPYLGSKTKEATALTKAWEKEDNIPLIKKAVGVRSAVCWFIKPESNLAEAIFSNLRALTNEEWDKMSPGYIRSGTALHRYACGRQSNAGYAACSAAKLLYTIPGTDGLQGFGISNFDFMHQSVLITMQAIASEIHLDDPSTGVYHAHINCKECVREIENIWLDTDLHYTFPNDANEVKKWLPSDADFCKKVALVEIQDANVSTIHPKELSYHVGRTQAFTFCDLAYSQGNGNFDDSTIFPVSVGSKVHPFNYLSGLFDGMLRSALVQALTIKIPSKNPTLKDSVLSRLDFNIENILKSGHFLKTLTDDNLLLYLRSIPHKVPPTFPSNDIDKGSTVREFFAKKRDQIAGASLVHSSQVTEILIFADCNTPTHIGLQACANELLPVMLKEILSGDDIHKIRSWNASLFFIRTASEDLKLTQKATSALSKTDQELRYAVKNMKRIPRTYKSRKVFGDMPSGYVNSVSVVFVEGERSTPLIPSAYIVNPLISGLRPIPLATGAYLKIHAILSHFKIKYRDAAALGDGSGGIASFLARVWVQHKQVSNAEMGRVLFNSLPDLERASLQGTEPGGPAAVMELNDEDKARMVGLDSLWMRDQDLRRNSSWEGFIKLKDRHGLKLDLIVMDMEPNDEESRLMIEKATRENIQDLMSKSGILIYKSHLTTLLDNKENALTLIGSLFRRVEMIQTSFSSSYTSEVFILCQYFRDCVETDLAIEWGSCRNFIENAFCNRQPRDELNRARYVASLDLISGMPKELKVDPSFGIHYELVRAGVPDVVALRAAKVFSHAGPKSGVECAFILLGIACKLSYYAGTAINQDIGPLSDEATVKFLSFYTGVYLWLSMVTDDCEKFEMLNKMINDGVVVSFGSVLTKKGKLIGKWSLVQKLRFLKKIHFYSDAAAMGRVIRHFSVKFGLRDFDLDWTEVNKILDHIQQGTTVQRLSAFSPYLDLFKKDSPFIVINKDPMFSLESTDKMESHFEIEYSG